MFNNEIIVVLGGARSGKSSFAEKIAAESAAEVFYVATSEIRDREMELRVKKHREQRPKHWKTIEEPLHPEKELKNFIRPSTVILFDCLTLWVSNLLLNENLPFSGAESEDKEAYIIEKAESLIELIKNNELGAVFVSNEIGTGIVPGNPLSRTYRDIVGRVNQCFAANASRVYMTFAGIPVDLKKIAET